MISPYVRPFSGTLRLTSLDSQDIHHGLQLELVLAGQQDLVVLLVELDVGVRVLQVVALVDFLQRLLHGVEHFRHFDLGDYVEAVVGHSCYSRIGLRRSGSGRLDVQTQDGAGADAQRGRRGAPARSQERAAELRLRGGARAAAAPSAVRSAPAGTRFQVRDSACRLAAPPARAA